MKTTEFIKEVEAMGFNVSEGEGIIYVRNREIGEYLADISTNCLYMLDTDYDGTLELSEDKRHKLFTILTEYASTPIKERQEKKYMYLLKCFSENKKNCLYLTYDRNNEFFTLDYQDTDMQLTFKENDPLLKIVNLDIFEKIEVEE